MLTDYASVSGPQELWNTVRLKAYLTNVGSPFTTGADICGCDTLTASNLPDPADDGTPTTGYDTPAADPAPWFDADLPESGDFLGFLPLSITGLDDNPRARSVTNAVGGGGIFGPQRVQPRTITITGLLIGASCCGAEFGIHYLSEALAGCTGDTCDGDCLTMFNCCPDTVLSQAELEAKHRRTFRRAALVSGPTVTERTGNGTCARGACGGGGDIIQVEFVLVAAAAWPWTDLVPLLDVGLPATGSGPCIEWCLSSSTNASQVCAPGECAHAPCKAAADKCADPTRVVPAPPSPSAPNAPFCLPVASERACYTVDLSTRPQWSSDVPVITLLAGSSELRNVRITIYEKPVDTTLTCDQVADASRCDPLNDFVITYVPANGTVTIDGQVGRATTECDGECRTASTVFGDADGGPVRIREMSCAMFCLCIEVDPSFPPAADAHLSLSVSGRMY